MFGWNNDAYDGRGFGRGNRGQGRGGRDEFGSGFGGGFGHGRGRGRGRSGKGRGMGGGFAQGFGRGRGRFDDFGEGRMGRGPCGMGLNREFRAAGSATESFGPSAGFCPMCSQHCPLSAPACPRGQAYAARRG